MFKKYAFLYLSLLCINIYSMDDSVILNQTHIPHDIIPYIEAIADLYEEMGIEFNQAIKYEYEFKNQIDKPIFQKIIELLSRSINIINHRSVSQIVNRDWCNVLEYIEGEGFSLEELVSMLEVINLLRIPLLEKPLLIHVIHVMVDMLKANQHKTVMKALSLIPSDYQNELKHLLYDYYPFDVWLAWQDNTINYLNLYLERYNRYKVLCTDDRNHVVSYKRDTIKVMTRNKKLLHTIQLSNSIVRNIAINNNYIVAVTSNSEIMIWHIISGLMIKEFVINSNEINIAYIDDLSFGYRDKAGVIFYSFHDLESPIASDLSHVHNDVIDIIYMTMGNAKFLAFNQRIPRISYILGSQVQSSLSFEGANNLSITYVYDKFNQSLPKINARGFLNKYMRITDNLKAIQNELCNQFNCMGSDDVHIHFKDMNNNDILIAKLPTYCMKKGSIYVSLVHDKLSITYDKDDEQEVIYYIHENNLIDILNAVYPYDNSVINRGVNFIAKVYNHNFCSVM